MAVAKTGNIRGPAGPPGITGPQGPIGATGVRGSLWSSGSGVPVASGAELPGDMYLDTVSGDVYQFNSITYRKIT